MATPHESGGPPEHKLKIVDLLTPEPGLAQLVVNVSGCGICGSDLHARHHADAQADVLAEAGYDGFMRSDQPVLLGHELCGAVAAYGPMCRGRSSAGSVLKAQGVRTIVASDFSRGRRQRASYGSFNAEVRPASAKPTDGSRPAAFRLRTTAPRVLRCGPPERGGSQNEPAPDHERLARCSEDR